MRQRHQMKKPERINLIPIMDAVFIFIFFLLMSAQFIDVFEIGSSVPMVKEISEEKAKKNPLNLVVEVNDSEIIVKTGKDGAKSKAFSDQQWNEMRSFLLSLKKQHPDEKVAMIRPKGAVPFHRLVKVIDHVKGDPATKSKMFEEIVFDGKGII